FRGAERSFRGRFFTAEDARLYTLPKEAPPIYVAASGPQSAELAAGSGDGLISTSPDRELVGRYERAGGKGKPKFIELRLCWGPDPKAGRRLVHEIWPTSGLGGQLAQELRRPADFEAAVEPLKETDTAGDVHADVIGARAVGSAEPIRRDAIFRISSMTKPITAAATMILVDEGRIRLDEAVDRLLPELADRQVLRRLDGPLDDTVPAKRRIAVRDLLTFTMGFGLVFGPPDAYPIVGAMNDLEL